MTAEQESNFETLVRLIKEEGDSIRAEMATKDDLKHFATKDDLKRFATKDDVKSIESRMATKDDLKSFATKDDLQLFATKDDIRTMATKEDVRVIVTDVVDNLKKELLAEIRPLAKAIDKDAVTIVNHGRRIRRIEKHLAFE